ncbi:hypothetical protein Dacet_0925 [Denitrovibrio acetiphilus DSM 12809]|uniref:Uncharacterized protein n=1 Tax=Denitrovibrio acetiphilus (strain DSM 12809 / NBRC 114555 / N2460) TaxID=522772 RepID=D4H657_DENA2|nr:hypothetical protein [Denitrovibrio acetiphilus]ADD67703.1 hypothetical protein Dacet_0925 [Denitrovibrio acetiphilus DSM 12809]
MRNLLLIIVLFIPCWSYAGDFIADAPKTVREYENFYIKLHKTKDFSVSVNKSCMTISNTEGITETDGLYSSEEGGKLYFDNFCFEKERIKIEITTERASEIIRFLIAPRKAEERDYSC